MRRGVVDAEDVKERQARVSEGYKIRFGCRNIVEQKSIDSLSAQGIIGQNNT